MSAEVRSQNDDDPSATATTDLEKMAELRDERYSAMETVLSEVKRDMLSINSKLQLPEQQYSQPVPLESPSQDECREFRDESLSDSDSLDGEGADGHAYYSPLKGRSGARSSAVQPPLWSQPRQPPDGASSIEDLMTSVKSDFTALARILDTEGDSSRQPHHHSGRGSSDDLHLEKLQKAGAGLSITTNSLAMSGSDDLDASFTEEYQEDDLKIALRHRRHPEDRTQSDPTCARTMDRDSLEPLEPHDAGVYGAGGLWGTSTFRSGDANATQQDAAYYPEFSDKTRDILMKIKAKSGQPQQPPSRPPPLPPLPKPTEGGSTSSGTAADGTASEETDAPPGSPAESSEDEESDISDFIINTYEKDASYDQPSFEYQSIHDILRASSQMIGSSRCLFPILEESSDEISSSEDEEDDEDDEAWLPAAKIEEKYASPMETEEEEVALRSRVAATHRDIEMQEIRKSDPDFGSAVAAAAAAALSQENRLRAARSAEELQSGGLQSDSATTFYTARESCESFATVTEGRAGSGDNSLRGSQLIETEEESDEAEFEETGNALLDEPMKQVAAAAAAAAAVQSSLAEKTPTPMPRAALRRLEPEAADIEYSTSDEDDESSSSTATSSSATRDGDDESTDTEPSYGEDGVRDEGVEAEVTEAADIADSIQQPMDDDVEQARKRKAQEEPPVVKVPRLDDEPSVSSEQSAEQSESESASSESSSEQSAASETSERSGPVAPQANNSSCAELLGEVTAVEAAPAVEKPLTLERVSASSYQYLPAVALDPWRGGGGAVQAVASSRARITTAKGERLDLIGMETADDVADDSEVSGGSEAFVTTEASGANPSAAIARATARAASIAGAALARGRARQGAEEYRIFISTSCTVRPSPVLEPSRLQITVSSDSELQQRQQPADSSLVIGEAEKKRVVSSPRRLDSRDSSENVFSLLRLGRQDTTQETITQELPSPAKGDKTDYADFEAVTRSVIQSRYNTERREDIADDYCRRASKAVQAEVQLMEQLKADESAQPTDLLGRIRSDQERFHDLKRQLDALKARQLARQRLLETPRELTTIPPRSPTVPSPKTPEEQRPPTISPQSGDSTMLGGNMAESAYISDSSDPSSPTSAEKANPHEPQRLPYRSVLQEAALLPGGARPTPRHHQSSLQLDQERLQRARNEYFRRPMFDPASKAGQSGSMRSGGSNSPSDYRARSASSTLSKTSSQSMYQLRELMDDQSALQAYSQLTGSGRRRYMSTDIDDLPDDGKAGGTPEGGSTYDLNAFDTEPGNYKSVSLFDLRRSMLANDARVANVTANDSKSYVSLIETDVDTGEELSHEIVMETDVDIDSPLSPAPKSQSLMDLAGMPRPNPGGIFDGLGARDAELDRRLNRANSEDMLDSGAAPTTARRVKASRNNSKRLQQQQQQQQEKTFIQRLEERATSESEKAICKSLSRLDIPKWMDNLKLNQNSASAVTVMASAVDAPKPWSAKYRDGPGSTAGIDHTDQSLQPLIIPKFVSLPVRPALFSPGYSSLSVRRDEATESDFERTQVATERSQPPPQTAPEEPRKKYFTESSIRRDSLSVAAVAASVRQQQAAPPAQARPPISPSLVLAPLKLDPSDFLPKTEKSAAVADEPRLEPSVAPRTAVVSESSALPPAPSPPRLSTLPPELLDGSSDESQNVGDDQPVSEASNIMFIDRSFRESSEQQLQQHFGDTSTTVSTDFPSDSQSDSGSASADRQQYEDDEETESSGSSEDSSDDSSTTGSSSSKSFSSGSPETSEAEDSGDEEEEVPQKPQPQSEPLTQTQYQLTNGSAKKGSSEFKGPESEQSSKLLSSSSQLQKKQHSRTASSSSSEGSSGSSGSGSSEDESAESEEETVIETSMMQSRLGRQPELDERLLASQAAGAAIVTFADGLGRQSQTAAALAYAEQQLATARSSRLSAPLAAAAAALPIPRFSQNGRNSPSVSLATEIPLAAGQNRGIIRDAGRYLVECVNPRCARRAELPEAQRSFVACSSCYTYYCSVVCRRSHWEAHKRNCAFARAADACRNAAKRLLNDHTTYRALSTLARAGNRNLGRGCVLLLLADVGDSSAPLRPPVFAPVGDLGACGLVGEQLSEVAAACRSFDPSNAFVLCAGVSVGTESSAAGSGSGALVTAWSVLRLAPEDPATKEAVASVSAAAAAAEAAAEAAAAEAERRREEQMRQSRADLLDRVRRELRQRGVSLRHHYPRLMSALQEFVDTGAEFPPQVIRPVDTTCGKTFEYCVQPGADPVTRWVEPQQPPQPAPRRQQLQPPAPIRRSVVSTDL